MLMAFSSKATPSLAGKMKNRNARVCSRPNGCVSFLAMSVAGNPTGSAPDCRELESLVRRGIPDAEVKVRLFSGDDHFDMRVVAASFAGKSRVRRHQMVYRALGEHMRAGIHALALQTLTPEEQE